MKMRHRGQAANRKVPKRADLIKRMTGGRRGLSGLIVAALLIGLPWIILNWEATRGFPPIAAALHYLTQKPLPKASPGRFAVALMHLEADPEREFQNLIVENLKDFEGIQILQFDRTIEVEGTKPSNSEEAGYRRAQSYWPAPQCPSVYR